MTPYVQVRSEVGLLKRVLVHRPGAEMERLVPWTLQEMLFEDIPWVSRMRDEHDAFVAALTAAGAEVVYVTDLLQDVLADDQVAAAFADSVLDQAVGPGMKQALGLRELFLAGDKGQRAGLAIAGLSQADLPVQGESLSAYFSQGSQDLLPPLPNMYFSRDPATAVGNSLVISAMSTPIRQREALLLRLIARHHPLFANTRLLCDPTDYRLPLEGGDLLVLSGQALAVGCSQRTSLQAVEYLARQVLSEEPGYERVLAVSLPHERAFMHLDTVMTMVDTDCFLVYPGVVSQGEAVLISLGAKGRLLYQRQDSIAKGLAAALGLGALRFVYSGGGHRETAAREQWNDAANTLALSPGRVIAYNRNDVSNRSLAENGIEVIPLEGSELVRGRGGPHCMSMPLCRD